MSSNNLLATAVDRTHSRASNDNDDDDFPFFDSGDASPSEDENIDPSLSLSFPVQPPVSHLPSDPRRPANLKPRKERKNPPRWSFRKPTTYRGKVNDMYGPKVKVRKRPSGLQVRRKSGCTYCFFTALIEDHALKEIEYYQRQIGILIPRSAFVRLCREILFQVHPLGTTTRMTASAFAALQQVSESIIVMFFELCNKAAIHAKRKTVMPKDATFVRDFIKAVDPTNPIGHAQNAGEESSQATSAPPRQPRLPSHGYLHRTSGSRPTVARKGLPYVKVRLSRSVVSKPKVIKGRVHKSR